MRFDLARALVQSTSRCSSIKRAVEHGRAKSGVGDSTVAKRENARILLYLSTWLAGNIKYVKVEVSYIKFDVQCRGVAG